MKSRCNTDENLLLFLSLLPRCMTSQTIKHDDDIEDYYDDNHDDYADIHDTSSNKEDDDGDVF